MTANQVVRVEPKSAVALMTSVDTKSVVARVQAIQHVMAAVMKDGVHYGNIPGTDKPSLYKQGSEVLLSAFQISVEPLVEEITDGDHVSYTVRCIGRHIPTGNIIGTGVGAASTAEEKYAWRAAVCAEEYAATPEDRRRVKWNKGKWVDGAPGPGWKVEQVRTNPRDLANTVLKMAKKRAQIDMSLTALAASDLFSQDLEDLPAEYIDQSTGEVRKESKPKSNRYTAKEKTGSPQGSGSENPATEGQVKLIKAKAGHAKLDEAEICKHFSVESIEQIKMGKVNDVLAYIAEQAKAANG